MAGPLSTHRWQQLRAAYLANNPTCAIRGERCTITATTVDHIIPRSRGGPIFDPNNLRPACAACNYARGNGTRGQHQASRNW